MKPKINLNKKNSIITAAIILILTTTLTAWLTLRTKPLPDPQDQTPDQIAQTIASENFANHDLDTQKAYLDQARKHHNASPRNLNNLSDQQRRQVMKNISPIMRQQMQQRMDEFFQLPTDQRQQHLDNIIDRIQAGQNQRPQNANRPRLTPDRLRNRIENTDPKQRAQFVEFIDALQKRMKERGLDFPPRR